MLHSDIDGSKPKVERKLESRDHHNVQDILGAKPRLAVVRKVVHNQTYEDVSK